MSFEWHLDIQPFYTETETRDLPWGGGHAPILGRGGGGAGSSLSLCSAPGEKRCSLRLSGWGPGPGQALLIPLGLRRARRLITALRSTWLPLALRAGVDAFSLHQASQHERVGCLSPLRAVGWKARLPRSFHGVSMVTAAEWGPKSQLPTWSLTSPWGRFLSASVEGWAPH